MEFKKYTLGDLIDNFSIRAKNIGGSKGLEFLGVSNEDGITKSKYAAEEKSEDYKIIEQGCFAYNPYRINVGSIAYMSENYKGLISPAYVIFKTKPESIDDRLLLKFLKSAEGIRQIKLHARGSVRQALRFEDLCKIEIFLPTFTEQKILLDKIEGVNFDSSVILNELNIQLNYISQLRQAFLREAMQGKLVSNETSDGKTGADLLQEIQAEKEKLIKEKKIKKSKPLPPIFEDEIPFEIPKNWAWCRVDDISSKIGSGSTPKGSNYSLDGYPFFRSQNIHNYGLVYDDIKFIDEETHQRMNGTTVYDNDLLLNITGGSLGRCALVPDDFEEGNVSQHVCIIRGIKIIPKFYHYLVLSPYFQSLIFKSTTGAGREGLPKYNLEQFIIGVPPLEIQNRIVSKLNELMKHCDDLEKSVQESQNYNEQLLQQVLREALEGKNEVENENLKLVAEESPIYSIQNTINKNCDTVNMAILAGYIIKKLSTQNSKDFGRVKLQKMLHLVEYHCQLSSELKYQKNVAGPHAWELEHVIEPKLKSLRFFEIKKDKFGATSKVTYTPLSASNELTSLFNREFKDQAESINNLLDKFQDKNWEFCERISTMYAVWNNRLIRKELFTDEILKQDFLAWDDKKKRFIDVLDHTLEWIRKEKIEPVGFGDYIDKK
ncbi:restriction endonuclease subunit S [Chryseobacterium taihuense]|uniref:Type I restriction enzyme, S subunit n=1 Tax=Chryseobacterium taihuense TaxID=1141221 RepID=A0ABY0R2K7_9FLAO|nr:restriction endonuclease subunit S [Chryseobacterium taihuense]SDM32940.1 type I restriction enzyme, S subunit [Chryseobacterium taihuense]